MQTILNLICITLALVAITVSSLIFHQNQRLKEVTDNQGQVIFLMIQTPEINAAMRQELERRAASTASEQTKITE